MKKPVAEFLKAGLEYYPAAVEAVSQFEKEVYIRLKSVLRKFLEAHDDVFSVQTFSFSEQKGLGPDDGYWIYVEQFLGNSNSVRLGLWWSAPEFRGVPYFLYVRMNNSKAFRVPVVEPQPPVEFREMSRAKYFLVRQPDLDNLDDLGAQLLEHLRAQLQPQA